MNESWAMPHILYHASTTPGIINLRPAPHPGVGGQSVVFATSDPLFALAMTHGTGNQLAVGYYHDPVTNQPRIFVDELEPGALGLLQATAVLYEVDPTDFMLDSHLSAVEYISRNPVPVRKETQITNILETLRHDSKVDVVPYGQVLEAMQYRGRKLSQPQQPHAENRFGE